MHDIRLREEAQITTRTTRDERQLDIRAGQSAAVGWRIDAYITEIFPRFTRSLVQKWLKRNYVRVNDTIVRPGFKLRGGE